MVDFSYWIIACEYLLVSLLNFYVLFFIKQLLKVQNMNIARDKNKNIRYRFKARAKTPQGEKPKKILFLLNKTKLILYVLKSEKSMNLCGFDCSSSPRRNIIRKSIFVRRAKILWLVWIWGTNLFVMRVTYFYDPIHTYVYYASYKKTL